MPYSVHGLCRVVKVFDTKKITISGKPDRAVVKFMAVSDRNGFKKDEKAQNGDFMNCELFGSEKQVAMFEKGFAFVIDQAFLEKDEYNDKATGEKKFAQPCVKIKSFSLPPREKGSKATSSAPKEDSGDDQDQMF